MLAQVLKYSKKNNIDLRIIIETHSDVIINTLGDLIIKESINHDQLNIVIFDKESEETFTENNIEQTDKIDIYIRDKALSSSFGSNGNVYFAIECKRIKIKSDSKEYVLDIEKFSKRSHIATRLPFEGQIAFIENNKLNHKLIKDEVNLILKQISTIKTDLFLQQEKLHSSIDGTYLSKHRRNFNQKSFSIYHLMLDYSKVVIG